jgi:hypothetical protein
MNIYLSHARKDIGLALQLAERLESEGFTVLHPETDPEPGGNWASKIAKALKSSDFMVFLFTPGAMESDTVHNDVELALGSKKYEDRVFSVIVGATNRAYPAGNDVPWILLKQPHKQVESAKGFAKVVKEIAAQCANSNESSSHA